MAKDCSAVWAKHERSYPQQEESWNKSRRKIQHEVGHPMTTRLLGILSGFVLVTGKGGLSFSIPGTLVGPQRGARLKAIPTLSPLAADLVAAVGEMEPEFPQVLQFQNPIPAGVGQGGLTGESVEEAPDLKIAVGVTVGPILQEPVAPDIN